jgi:hypothetical protein
MIARRTSSTLRTDDSLDGLRAVLADRTADLVLHLLGDPNRALSGKIEWRYGSHGSLAITAGGGKSGLWFDHELGEGGDMLSLIMRERSCGFAAALDFARDFCCGGDWLIHHAAPARRAERQADDPATRRRTARFLWSQRKPIEASPAENYLRVARGYAGPIAPTLAYVPARDQHQHALIAAFGIPAEPEPGILHMPDDAVLGVHLIRLNADGSDRIRDKTGKITVGHCLGSPIVCAPFHDSNNTLAIAEGVENALAAHLALGIGGWAAGGASRLPALADAMPDYVDCVTVIADDDDAGRRHAATLAHRLCERGFEVRLTPSFVTGGDA